MGIAGVAVLDYGGSPTYLPSQHKPPSGVSSVRVIYGFGV